MKDNNGLPILLVIDMLNDFVHPEGSLYNKKYRDLIPQIVDKIQEFIDKGYPVIYVGDNHSSDDIEFDLFPEHCTTTWGSSFIEIIDNLIELNMPLNTELPSCYVINKTSFSPFIGNEFGVYNADLFFDILKPSEIHVVGILSNICVLYTVSDLVQFGFRNIYVYKDCTASNDDTLHEFALKQMKEVLKVNVV